MQTAQSAHVSTKLPLRNVNWSASVPTLYTLDRSLYVLHYDSETAVSVVGRQMLTHPPMAQTHRSSCFHLINPSTEAAHGICEWVRWRPMIRSYQLEQDTVKQLVNRLQSSELCHGIIIVTTGTGAHSQLYKISIGISTIWKFKFNWQSSLVHNLLLLPF